MPDGSSDAGGRSASDLRGACGNKGAVEINDGSARRSTFSCAMESSTSDVSKGLLKPI